MQEIGQFAKCSHLACSAVALSYFWPSYKSQVNNRIRVRARGEGAGDSFGFKKKGCRIFVGAKKRHWATLKRDKALYRACNQKPLGKMRRVVEALKYKAILLQNGNEHPLILP